MQKHKVIILTSADPYQDVRAIKIAESLSEARYDVLLFGGYSNRQNINNTQYRVMKYRHLYQPQFSLFKKLWWKARYFVYSITRLHRERADVIHACNVDMLFLAYLATIFTHTRIVYDSFEIGAFKSGAVSKSAFLSKGIVLLEQVLIKKTEYMICVSNAALEYFRTTYKIENIIVVTNVPKVSGETLKRINNHERHPMNALYIGTFSENRGIEEFVLSAAHLEGKVNVCLQGFGLLEEKITKLIIENELGHLIQFFPLVDVHEIVHSISLSSDIGVVLTKPTSLNHQLSVSNKLFDYINAGIPVVMSNITEHRRINEQYEVGVIISEVQPEHIANALTLLATDKKLYEHLSINCIKARKELNWGIESRKLLNVYDKILEGKTHES